MADDIAIVIPIVWLKKQLCLTLTIERMDILSDLDGILLDEDVAACLDRYLQVLAAACADLHAADLQNAWNGKKDQIKEEVKDERFDQIMLLQQNVNLHEVYLF